MSFSGDSVPRKALLLLLIAARRVLRSLSFSRRPQTSNIYVRQLRLLHGARARTHVLCSGFCTTLELHFKDASPFGRTAGQFTGTCAVVCVGAGMELTPLQPEGVGEVHCRAGSVLLCSAEDLPRLQEIKAGGVQGGLLYMLLASDKGVVAGKPSNHTAKPQMLRRLRKEIAALEVVEFRSRQARTLQTWKRARCKGKGGSPNASSGPRKTLGRGSSGPTKRLRKKSKAVPLTSTAPPLLDTPPARVAAEAVTPRQGAGGDVVPSGDIVPSSGDGVPLSDAVPSGHVVPSGDVVPSSGDVVPLGDVVPVGDVVPTPEIQGQTIHRYWVDAGQTGELPRICLVSLRSFSPEYKQILWHYTPLVDPCVPNVVLKDANDVLPREVYSEMVGMKALPEHISDLWKATIIYTCGGWAIDLDFLYLGRPLPMAPGGICLHAEPERKPSFPYSRQDELVRRCEDARTGLSTLNCGLMGGVQGDRFWDIVAKRILEGWRGHRARMRCTRGAGADIGPVSMLMGARVVQAVVLEAARKGRKTAQWQDAHHLDPIHCCPLPRFLQVWHREEPTSLQGYLVPSAAQVAQQSSCIQLWEKKWPRNLVRQVLCFATRLRACRKMSLLVQLLILWDPIVKEVEARLATVTLKLCHIYGNVALAHTVVAFALSQLAGKSIAEMNFLGAREVREPGVIALALLQYSHRFHRSHSIAGFGEGCGFIDTERRMAALVAPSAPQKRVEATIARCVMLAGRSSLVMECVGAGKSSLLGEYSGSASCQHEH